jgi:hypothetical protein
MCRSKSYQAGIEAQRKRINTALQGALTMVQKKKLSVAGIQLRAKKVLDSQADELEEEKKFIVKVNEDLDNVQSQLKEAEQQISQMLIGNVSMEDKVGYMQSLAAKMEKLKTLSYPLPNKPG